MILPYFPQYMIQIIQQVINDDLNKISESTDKWKMLFNPGLTKQA